MVRKELALAAAVHCQVRLGAQAQKPAQEQPQEQPPAQEQPELGGKERDPVGKPGGGERVDEQGGGKRAEEPGG
eukprot:639385-Prymnesium_polylepis.1